MCPFYSREAEAKSNKDLLKDTEQNELVIRPEWEGFLIFFQPSCAADEVAPSMYAGLKFFNFHNYCQIPPISLRFRLM